VTNAAHVKAKLKKIADETGKDFGHLLMHYFIERLLYRLSISPYADNFILKGGLLLYTVLEHKARATRDIDFLAQRINNVPDKMLKIFAEIAVLPSDDAVVFDIETLTAERIKEDVEYEGLRIKLTGYLDRSRHVLQFDIGFGDVVIPRPISMAYPSLLNMEPPQLKAYTLESVIAEKFHAGVCLAEANSRMKDFYDIYELCASRNFEGSGLYRAILETFECRKTDLPQNPAIFSKRFSALPDKQAQWKAFCHRIGVAEGLEFQEIITAIRAFLVPVYDAIYDKSGFSGQWDGKKKAWQTALGN